MSDEEMIEFRRQAGHKMALKVRVYDDLGKEPQMQRPELEYYVPMLKRCLVIQP